jgi:predicted RND superfamily exporter protein
LVVLSLAFRYSHVAGVVLIGVIWSFGTIHLLGIKSPILTALIPPLIVVIGIPNCIYFLKQIPHVV